MKIVINKKLFIIKFAYHVHEDVLSDTYQRETVCYIKVIGLDTKEDEEPITIVSESASCDSRDNFVKAKGRAIAFKRALTQLFGSDIREEQGLNHEHYVIFMSTFKEECSTSVEFI